MHIQLVKMIKTVVLKLGGIVPLGVIWRARRWTKEKGR